MQFSVAAFLALAGSAIAQYVEPTPGFNPLTTPTSNEVIPAGKPFTIKWTPAGGNGAPVSLYAYAGESASTLGEVGTIATGIDVSAGSYVWQVEPALGGKYKAYGIRIALASNKDVYQWSNPFTISGDGASTSSGASSSSAASTSSSATAKTESSTSVTKSTSASSSVPTIISASSGFRNSSSTAATVAPTSSGVFVTSTATAIGGGSTATRATTAATTVPTGGAVAKGAGSLAVIGGLAMAVLAL